MNEERWEGEATTAYTVLKIPTTVLKTGTSSLVFYGQIDDVPD